MVTQQKQLVKAHLVTKSQNEVKKKKLQPTGNHLVQSIFSDKFSAANVLKLEVHFGEESMEKHQYCYLKGMKLSITQLSWL